MFKYYKNLILFNKNNMLTPIFIVLIICPSIMEANIMEIPPEVQQRLGYYVYQLIDPTNGKVFYIGKGKGDRVLSHIKEEANFDGSSESYSVLPLKLGFIKSLKAGGREPTHVIVRHGMTEQEAELVEAVLIQETSGLTNLVSGRGTDQFGRATLEELVGRYSEEPLSLNPNHKILIFKIKADKKSDKCIYESVRRAWKVNINRAKKADYIFAVIDRLVAGIFVADEWLEATKDNFPTLDKDEPSRYGFNGKEIDISEYKHKRLPDNFCSKGMSNPVRYNYK